MAGDRAFFLVDENGRLVNSKGLGALAAARAALRRGDRRARAARSRTARPSPGRSRLDGSLEAQFWGVAVPVRVVDGPWSEAISGFAGRSLRLVRAPGPATDRMRSGAATPARHRRRCARWRGRPAASEVDGRRFRMNFGIDGLEEHEEDGWLGRRVQLGEAVVVPQGNVGRCAVTTQNPDTGAPDLDTLKALAAYRARASRRPSRCRSASTPRSPPPAGCASAIPSTCSDGAPRPQRGPMIDAWSHNGLKPRLRGVVHELGFYAAAAVGGARGRERRPGPGAGGERDLRQLRRRLLRRERRLPPADLAPACARLARAGRPCRDLPADRRQLRAVRPARALGGLGDPGARDRLGRRRWPRSC